MLPLPQVDCHNNVFYYKTNYSTELQSICNNTTQFTNKLYYANIVIANYFLFVIDSNLIVRLRVSEICFATLLNYIQCMERNVVNHFII